MKNFSLIFIILVSLVILEIIAEVCIKEYDKSSKTKLILIGVFLYLFIPLLFLALIKQTDELIIANALWQVSNIILVAIVGYFYFKEKLSKYQWAGIVLSIFVVGLLMIEPKE
jgi:multidrug transporter EmrE-like cation transporter